MSAYRISYCENDRLDYKDFQSLEEARIYKTALEDVGEPIDSVGVFRIIEAEEAKALWLDEEFKAEIVALHDDGTESVIEGEDALNDYAERGFYFGVPVE